MPSESLAKRWRCVWGLIIALFGILQWQHHISSVQHHDWLGFLDHDTIYMTEMLLMKVQGTAFEPYHAMDVDYGVEVTLLSWLVRPFSALTGQSLGLSAYQVITATHILAAMGCLAMMVIISRTMKWPPWLTTGTLVVLVLSPLFTTYAGLVKPDANIVLLAILTSLWCALKLHETGHEKWLWLAWVIAAFAAAIKWWGIFMIPPLIYLQATQVPARATFARTRILTCVAGVLTIWVGWQSMFYLAQHFEKSGKSPAGIPLSLMQFMTTWTAWVLLALAVAGTVAALLCVQHLCIGKETRWSLRATATIETTVGLMAFTLLLDLPFLLDWQFINSVHYFSKYLILSPSDTTDLGLVRNLVIWIQDAFQSSLFSWVMAPILCVMAWRLFRSRSGDSFQLRVMLLYLGSLCLFLFLLVTKKNHATQAMMFPLILLALGQWLHTENWHRKWQLAVIATAVLLQILFQNGLLISTANFPPVTAYYQSRNTLEAGMVQFNERMAQLIPAGAKVYVCGTWVPLEDIGDRRLRAKDYSSMLRMLEIIQPGEWLVLHKGKNIDEEVARFLFAAKQCPKWEALHQLQTPYPGRMGGQWKKRFILFQRKN